MISTGAVNAHTHLYSGLAPLGMPPPEQAPARFIEILERVWWRLDVALDRETLRAAARYYVAHTLLAGTTTLIDHHESPRFIEESLDVLADACESLGCRAVLCYGATERNGGRTEAQRGLAECERFITANRRALVRGAVGLHASFTVSDATVRDAGSLAKRLGAALHVHVAEDGCDVEDAKTRGYDGVIARLDSLDALREGDVLAHGVWLTDAEVDRVNARGAWVVQCARSNENNRVGYPHAMKRATKVALGTDGFASEMAVEASELSRIAAAQGDDLTDIPRRIAGGAALAARFFGETHDTVRVEGRRVLDVNVGGRAVVRDGALVNADIHEIDAHARVAADALWRAMRNAP